MACPLPRHLYCKRLPCARKGSGYTRLDSFCTYTAEDLEILDTPVCVDHARTQDYNEGTFCECMTNYSFTNVNFVQKLCRSCEVFQ